MKLENISAPAHHRNGVSGLPFQVITFTMKENNEDPRRMIAVRFKDDPKDKDGFSAPRIAVFNIDLLNDGIIEMHEGNAWRGDHFADHLDQFFTITKDD